jgi:hypothetical protein
MKTELPKIERFTQSPFIMDAQAFLWEAALQHNAEDLIYLRNAIWNLEQELKRRTEQNKAKILTRADATFRRALKEGD